MNRFYWLAAILLSLSSNLDNVAVGVAFGIRRVRVPFTSNLVIAFITGAGTLAAMVAGQTIASYLDPGISRFVGGTILILLGGWIVVQQACGAFNSVPIEDLKIATAVGRTGPASKMLMVLENPFSADRDMSKHIDRKEALLLGCALSLNNLVNGVAAGMSGLSPAKVTTLVVLFSILTLWVGMRAGSYFCSRVIGSYTGVVSGLLLIVLGIYQILLRGHWYIRG